MAKPKCVGARRGRPRIIPTEEQREVVRHMRREGYTLYAIAKQVGVSIPTLKRAFYLELAVFNPKMLARIALSSYEAALEGKGAALGMWFKLVVRDRPKPEREPKPPKPPKYGSKAWAEQQIIEARRNGKLLITMNLDQNFGGEITKRIIAVEKKAAWEAQRKIFEEEDRALTESMPSE